MTCSKFLSKSSQFFLLSALGLSAAKSEPRVLERGPHHNVVESINTILIEDGSELVTTNSYVEMANGLNFRNEAGELVPAEESVELVPGAALAWKGQTRLSIAANINQDQSVMARLPDGRLLGSHIHGLAYYRVDTGESVLIATVKDRQGIVTAAAEISFIDAFDGVDADVVYTWTKAGYAQDVVLRSAPPPPSAYGLEGDQIELQAWTEFVSPPEPKKRKNGEKKENNPNRAGKADSLSLEDDEILDFDSMQISQGRSFRVGHEDENLGWVAKHWAKTEDDRTFLVEAIRLKQVEGELKSLPPGNNPGTPGGASVQSKPAPMMQALRGLPAKSTKRDQALMRRLNPGTDTDLIASLARPGLVVDYTTITANQANLTFRSDYTYFINGPVVLTGVTTLEGSTVIKFDSATTVKLEIQGPLICDVSPYRGINLTAKDDNSIGETISGSNPVNLTSLYYGNPALGLNNGTATVLKYLRFNHSRKAVAFMNGSSHQLWHSQITRAVDAIQPTGTTQLRNVLINNVGNVFSATAGTINAQHLTINTANAMNFNIPANLSIGNSLLVGVTTLGSYTTISGSANSTTATFQSAVGGNHYLPLNSSHRNAGFTANIDTGLLNDFKLMTTEAPTVLTGNISVPTVLRPRVARDADQPDLGAHFSPLDYVLSNAVLATTLTLTNGVAVGAAGSYGINLQAGSQWISEGQAYRPNRLVRWQSAQEQASTTSGNGTSFATLTAAYSWSPIVALRFTEVSAPANTGTRLIGNDATLTYPMQSVTIENCHTRNLNLGLAPNAGSTITFRNNCFERSIFAMNRNYFNQNASIIFSAYNNLFKNGSLSLGYDFGSVNYSWDIKDNLFDGATQSLTGNSTGYIVRSHDGFTSGTANSLAATSSQTGLTANYQTGSLSGIRYYPDSGAHPSLSVLINIGSRTRESAGLYHHTVQVSSGTKEATHPVPATATVDIGYHYVGVASSGSGIGLPIDSDGDGLPDYAEDRNGNGLADTGETHWNLSANGANNIPRLQVFTKFE